MESDPNTGTPPYIPINCSFYDRLEEAATLKREVVLRFRNGEHEEQKRGVIADLGITDGIEWLTLRDGFRLRLDHLIAMDGYEVPVAACDKLEGDPDSKG